MSLEAKVELLTTAVLALVSAIQQANGTPLAPIVGADPSVKPTTTAAKPAAVKDEPKAPAANDVSYDTIKKAFIALANAKGRDAAVAAIAPLPTLKEVEAKEQKPGQYKALLAAIEKAAA